MPALLPDDHPEGFKEFATMAQSLPAPVVAHVAFYTGSDLPPCETVDSRELLRRCRLPSGLFEQVW